MLDKILYVVDKSDMPL